MMYKFKVGLISALLVVIAMVLWVPIEAPLDWVAGGDTGVMISARCASLGPHRQLDQDWLDTPEGLTDDQSHELDEANITQATVDQGCGIARQQREVEVVLLAIFTASLAVGWHPRRSAPEDADDADDAQPRTPASPTVDPSA